MNDNIDILIMDDRDEKINAITQFLKAECNISEKNIHVSRTLNEGRTKLRETYFDLLILDLVMPNMNGEEANYEDAPKFIDEIYQDRDFNLPNQIIGFTAHEEEYENLKHRFEDKLWSLIKYKTGDSSWKNKIRLKVNHLVHSKKRLAISIIERHKHNIGVICALDEEFDQMRKAFGGDWKQINLDGFPIPAYSKTINTAEGNEYKVCAICIGQAGLISASSMTAITIKTFNLDYIFMTGIAAGFKGRDLHLGDVVISKLIVEPIIGKLIQDEGNIDLRKEIHSINSESRILSMAQDLASDQEFISDFNKVLRTNNYLDGRENVQIHSSPTVSVPFVIGSEIMMSKLQEDGDRKLAALDMEGYGFYQAASLLKTPCLWIKSISDLGDENKDDCFHKICSYASALFLYKLIKEKL